jgi:hypothetical protein
MNFKKKKKLNRIKKILKIKGPINENSNLKDRVQNFI